MSRQQSANKNRPSGWSTWDRTPAAFKVGLVIAILGFFVSITVFRSNTVNGADVSCSYYDLGAITVALIVAICAIAGFTDGRKRHPSRRPPSQALYGATIVLLVIAVVHALRGLGVIGGGC